MTGKHKKHSLEVVTFKKNTFICSYMFKNQKIFNATQGILLRELTMLYDYCHQRIIWLFMYHVFKIMYFIKDAHPRSAIPPIMISPCQLCVDNFWNSNFLFGQKTSFVGSLTEKTVLSQLLFSILCIVIL